MKEIKLTIDGQEITVPEGTTVLEAIKKLNKVVPTFCYHPKLPIFGGCRMCLVYEKRWRTNIIACATPAQEGMEIETENKQTFEERKFILEMLFTRHPLDCPICDKAGECDLQNWGTYYGPQINPSTITPFEKIRPEEDWQSDYFEFVSNRCVLCLRCISVCKNVVGADALFQEERGFEILISPDKKPMDSESSCEACGLCVDVCPVGAILFKPFKFNARAWLLDETVTYCGMCSMQCPVAIDHDQQKIYRIRSTADLEICAGAYLGYDIHSSNRLKGALINGQTTDINKAMEKVAHIINEAPQETAVVVSPYIENEALDKLKKLQEKTGIYVSSTASITLLPVIKGFIEENGSYTLPDKNDILEAERIIVAGNDVADTNPVISYFFHKNYLEGFEIGKDKEIIFIGEKAGHIKKYNPKHIQTDDLSQIKNINLDENTVVVYSTTALKGKTAYEFGKLLGHLYKETKAKVLILPQETNAYGVINKLDLDYLPDILQKIKKGKIKNLILYGEDIVDHISDEELQEIYAQLENSVVITPFLDGLALSSNIAIGSALWMEKGQTTEGFGGIRKGRKAFENIFTEEYITDKILQMVKTISVSIREKRQEIEFYDYEGFDYPQINLWDFGYLGRRSKNLADMRVKRSQLIYKEE
ncbi:2Fe-2S iron-sulfur cluster-binding protein [Persephonella sp. IF05-L8]|uniref:2Fe-2S iron-sulfur cluster-binding protein n=1 Tax=Persephonella sp. IF05-L8 TaxID=1158338 RepID=UPI000497E274